MRHSTPIPPPPFFLEKIRDKLRYDLESGKVIWTKPSGSKIKPGREAGAVVKRRGGMFYRLMTLDGENRINRTFLVHHIAYYLHTGSWPPSLIDHRDRDGTNNKWSNLRLADDNQSAQNRGQRRDNKTGTTGVLYQKRDKLYIAYISVNKKFIRLGYHKTLESAVAARKAAERKYHGEFCASNTV